MSRRRGRDHVRRLVIPVECSHEDRTEVVTRIRIHEHHRTLAQRSAASRSIGTSSDGTRWQAMPLDNWADVHDSYTILVHGGSGEVEHMKVRLRCRVPSCPQNLEVAPEVADKLVDWLLVSEKRRVELWELVAAVS